MEYKVERLLVNFKTMEEFKKFKEYGMQELSMLEDLEENIIENNSESPFFGVYFGDSLVARMSLYKKDADSDHYFDGQEFLVVWKLEVLPGFQGKGIGKALVNFAKSFNMPIKTNPRIQSRGFWESMGFETVPYDIERDLGENPVIWNPANHAQATA
jgi:GNAT superfamily N-acetyltransferase